MSGDLVCYCTCLLQRPKILVFSLSELWCVERAWALIEEAKQLSGTLTCQERTNNMLHVKKGGGGA